MKKIILYLIAAFALTNCAATTGINSKTGLGSLFTDIKEPVSNSAASTGSKRGEACSTNILGLVAVGDSSIIAARVNGGITKVATVDSTYLNVLALFGKYCTIVTGE